MPLEKEEEGRAAPTEEDVLEAIFNPNLPFGTASVQSKARKKEEKEQDVVTISVNILDSATAPSHDAHPARNKTSTSTSTSSTSSTSCDSGEKGTSESAALTPQKLVTVSVYTRATEEEAQLDASLVADEKQAIALAEAGEKAKALEAFNGIVDAHPTRAKGYNNRAQLHQLMGNPAAARADLDHAIAHCRLTRAVAQQVFSQRGVLRRTLDKDDEGARKDFELAARFGSQWARHQATLLNPYAALCNQMLSQAISKMQGQ